MNKEEYIMAEKAIKEELEEKKEATRKRVCLLKQSSKDR